MRRPELHDFGIGQHDVDWAKALEDRLPMVLAVTSAIGWGLYAALTAKGFHLGLAVLAAFFLIAPILFTTLILTPVCDFLLRVILPRYRHARRYLSEVERFRAWWARTQTAFWSSLSGKQFEAELANLFRRVGMRAELTPATGDQGVDIWLHTRRGKEIVQCKAHKLPVGPAIARELYGTLQHFGAPGAILASTSGFSRGTVEYVRNKPIRLLGLAEIIALQEKAGGLREVEAECP